MDRTKVQSTMDNRMETVQIRAAVLVFAVLPLLSGCVTSRQARDVSSAGFLGTSAALLQKGTRADEPLLVYRKAGADWASYDKIILDPVAIWSAQPSTLPGEQLADFQKLVDDFHRTLSDKLAKNYVMVNAPASGALRIEAAMVNGKQANQTLKVAKTIAPYASVADVLWTFVTGKPAFTGEVSIEYMIKDSVTGELLAAGVDRRVGGNQLGKATLTSWGDVQNILTYWSDLVVYRLCINRAAADCRKPSAGLLEPD